MTSAFHRHAFFHLTLLAFGFLLFVFGADRAASEDTGPAQPGGSSTSRAACRTPQSEAEYQRLKGQVDDIQKAAQKIFEDIVELERQLGEADRQATHFSDVMAGNEELTGGEADRKVSPAAGKADAEAKSASLKLDIARKNQALTAKGAEAEPLLPKIADLEKLKPCPTGPAETVAVPDPQPKEVAKADPVPPAPPVGPDCRTAKDEADLVETRRLIKFYESEVAALENQIKATIAEIARVSAINGMNEVLRADQIARENEKKASYEIRRDGYKIAVQNLSALVNAIMAKKPCVPPVQVFDPKPTPGIGQPVRKTETKKGRKAVERKPARVARQPVRPTAEPGVSPEAARAIGTMINIGIGVGLSQGRDRGRGEDERRERLERR